MLKITLRRSLIGYAQIQHQTAAALGLGRTGSSVVQPDTAPIRGMIRKLSHVLTVENVPEVSHAAAGRASRKGKSE